MSVASRIEAIETHIGDIYDSLELGGADLTNVNKNIVNINTQLIDRYKYYLANGIEVIWTNWEKVLQEGTDLTLNNTIKARLQLDLKGNTSQITTTTGKNKLPTIKASDTINQVVFTKNSDGSITVNGTASARTDLYLVGTSATDYGDLKLPAGKYTLSGCPATGSSSTYLFICVVKHSNDTSNTYIDYGTGDDINVFINSGDTFRMFIRIVSGVNVNNLTFYPQLESGSTKTSYEQFIPNSPSPDYPQDIHIVSGDNTITIANSDNTETQTQLISLGVENLFDGELEDGGISSSDGTNTETANRVRSKNYSITNGNTFTISCKETNIQAYIYCYDSSQGFLGYIGNAWNDLPYTFTTLTNTKYIRFVFKNKYNSSITKNDVSEVQIEKGSKANSYSEYGTTPLWLGKISTYQDYFYKSSGKWYLHKELGKVVLDGSEENWSLTTGTNKYSFWFRNNTIGALTQIHKKYCNLFSYTSNPYTVAGTPYLCENNATDNPSNFMFIFNTDGTQATTIQNWKTWLSTHNTEVYYILATPTNTEINDTTLISQLDNIEKLMSYNTQTNISQVNNDEPFIISASALKELS